MNFEWSVLRTEDTETLFRAQNELVLEHTNLTTSLSGVTVEEWKEALGFPTDDALRMEFLRNMPSASTKHGRTLHCLKLTCCRVDDDGYQSQAAIAGFIDFEVNTISDALSGNGREIYIRSIIVCPRMRRCGCAKMLYDAMLEHLGPGEFDAIRLYVVDLNEAAIKFYFQLGFKVTKWFPNRLRDEPCFEVVFLCMQKLQGKRLSRPGALPVQLQDMPHIFQDQLVGEIVEIAGKDGHKQRARIESYDANSRLFALAGNSGQVFDSDICVNELYSCGHLTFEKAPTILHSQGKYFFSASSSSQTARIEDDHASTASTTTGSAESTCGDSTPGGSSGSDVSSGPDVRKRLPWPSSTLVQSAKETPEKCEPPRKRVAWPSSTLLPACRDALVEHRGSARKRIRVVQPDRSSLRSLAPSRANSSKSRGQTLKQVFTAQKRVRSKI